jgi:hypothetical protein
MSTFTPEMLLRRKLYSLTEPQTLILSTVYIITQNKQVAHLGTINEIPAIKEKRYDKPEIYGYLSDLVLLNILTLKKGTPINGKTVDAYVISERMLPLVESFLKNKTNDKSS